MPETMNATEAWEKLQGLVPDEYRGVAESMMVPYLQMVEAQAGPDGLAAMVGDLEAMKQHMDAGDPNAADAIAQRYGWSLAAMGAMLGEPASA